MPIKSPIESDDSSGSFGGLADVLEPDPDAITSLRNVRVPSVRAERARAPVQVQDFAFADTVFAPDIPEDPPPPSGPIYVNDDGALGQQCVTPLAFPLPPAAESVDFTTRVRVLASHVRHAVRRSREEMRELWAGTAEMVDASGARNMWLIRRAFALWSCFQWSRADVTRAAMIGVGVFITAATIGAATMDLGDGEGSSAAASTGVRPARTLDQHTGKKIVLRAKR